MRKSSVRRVGAALLVSDEPAVPVAAEHETAADELLVVRVERVREEEVDPGDGHLVADVRVLGVDLDDALGARDRVLARRLEEERRVAAAREDLLGAVALPDELVAELLAVREAVAAEDRDDPALGALGLDVDRVRRLALLGRVLDRDGRALD